MGLLVKLCGMRGRKVKPNFFPAEEQQQKREYNCRFHILMEEKPLPSLQLSVELFLLIRQSNLLGTVSQQKKIKKRTFRLPLRICSYPIRHKLFFFAKLWFCANGRRIFCKLLCSVCGTTIILSSAFAQKTCQGQKKLLFRWHINNLPTVYPPFLVKAKAQEAAGYYIKLYFV